MSTTVTETIEVTEEEEVSSGQSSAPTSSPVLRIKLKPKKTTNESVDTNDQKKVKFTEETVDNEGLDRKKSKCCCIYHKPHTFDESSDSSDSDGETDHCYGHKSCQSANG